MSRKIGYLALSLVLVGFVAAFSIQTPRIPVDGPVLPTFDNQVCFDFNDSDGGWTAGGYADWEWGTPSNEIDGNAWETNLGADYFNDACGWIDSPVIYLGHAGGWMSFDAYDDVQKWFDGWNVQISLDNGATWNVIEPVEGYKTYDPLDVVCDEGLEGPTNAYYDSYEIWNFRSDRVCFYRDHDQDSF